MGKRGRERGGTQNLMIRRKVKRPQRSSTTARTCRVLHIRRMRACVRARARALACIHMTDPAIHTQHTQLCVWLYPHNTHNTVCGCTHTTHIHTYTTHTPSLSSSRWPMHAYNANAISRAHHSSEGERIDDNGARWGCGEAPGGRDAGRRGLARSGRGSVTVTSSRTHSRGRAIGSVVGRASECRF